MNRQKKQELITYLEQYVSENKRTMMHEILPQRTRYVVPVLEDMYQTHNISAVLRTTDCLGVQDVHIIEERNQYAVNIGVAKGASQWLNINRYNDAPGANTAACFAALREQGYRIAATTPHEAAYNLHELPLDQKTAVVFGAELVGLTEYALENADMAVTIPMYGFTESFNISVSAAICLYDLTNRLRTMSDVWRLSEDERLDVHLSWLRATIEYADALERQFFKSL